MKGQLYGYIIALLFSTYKTITDNKGNSIIFMKCQGYVYIIAIIYWVAHDTILKKRQFFIKTSKHYLWLTVFN